MQRTTLLVALVALLVGATAAVGAASIGVSVDQPAGEEPTVSVVENDTDVENASVTVEPSDENVSYAGTGNYTTDANGTVGLPAPEENVSVEVTATSGNATASTTETLTPMTENESDEASSFGQQLRQFVLGLDDDETGQTIASWVVANNPGNAPDHAGPGAQDDAGTDSANASDDGDARGDGPPAHAGGSDDDKDEEEVKSDDEAKDDDEDENGGGPPAHAGGPGGPDDETAADDEDDADDESDDEEDDEDEEDEEDDEEDDDESDETETETET